MVYTKDCAKLMRQALKQAFPGVKFSVRCDTGTASGWIDVRFPRESGLDVRQVSRVCSAYQGEQFNGSTDSYDRISNDYACCGVSVDAR